MSAPMIAGCYVAWNEAALIGESIRSIKAYVDRFVVVDCAFSTNPAEGPVASTDGQRAVVERACAGKPLTYIVPPARLEEQAARNRYLAELGDGEWAFLIDADEILVADHQTVLGHLGNMLDVRAAELCIYTSAVLFNGNADAMTREEYETAPVITTRGFQPRIVRADDTLHYQRDEIAPGIFTHAALWRRGTIVEGRLWASIGIVNRHVAQPFEGYQADYAWETAQRDGAR